ncbi:unnamed protein product, partial [Laminaria digitata]
PPLPALLPPPLCPPPAVPVYTPPPPLAVAVKIAMLIEHLKADDLNLRVTATTNLPAIADALGPERVRAELVPFIHDSTDDEDEVRRSL